MQAVLAASDLACRRGDRVLFSGLDLTLAGGEGLHVTGANGAGKSSLLRLLAGLATPMAGSVECSAGIGLLDENPALDPDLPLGHALEFWFDLDGAIRDADIYSQLLLTDLLEVPVRYLSTGQRKRAAFARLIAQDTGVWLLDEPLSGLDTKSRELVDGMIADFLDKGGVAVVASHQPLERTHLKTIAIEDFTK